MSNLTIITQIAVMAGKEDTLMQQTSSPQRSAGPMERRKCASRAGADTEFGGPLALGLLQPEVVSR